MSNLSLRRVLAALPTTAALLALVVILAVPTQAQPRAFTVPDPMGAGLQWQASSSVLWWEHVATGERWNVSATLTATTLEMAEGVSLEQVRAVDPQLARAGTRLRWQAWRTTCTLDGCIDRHRQAVLRIDGDLSSSMTAGVVELWVPITTTHTRVDDHRVLRVFVTLSRMRLILEPTGFASRHEVISATQAGHRQIQHVVEQPLRVLMEVDGQTFTSIDGGLVSSHVRVSRRPGSPF